MQMTLVEKSSELTVAVFLFIVFLSFLIMFLCGDNEEKTYQKIIGGLSVFIVAIITGDRYVSAISLFIGGLIIASEKFLKSLAAILKSDGINMPKTLAALNDVELSYASEAEINIEKQKEEESEPEKNEKLNEIEKEQSSKRRTSAEIRDIEDRVLKLLSEKYKHCFTPNIKLENVHGQIVVDGVIHYSGDSGKLNLDNALTLVEIKYIHNVDSRFIFETIARRVIERIRFLLVSKQILIVFCSPNLTTELTKTLNERLTSLFSKDKEQDDVVFGFIKIDQGTEPEVLQLSNLKPHVL